MVPAMKPLDTSAKNSPPAWLFRQKASKRIFLNAAAHNVTAAL
jgi:hypothetical protein